MIKKNRGYSNSADAFSAEFYFLFSKNIQFGIIKFVDYDNGI